MKISPLRWRGRLISNARGVAIRPFVVPIRRAAGPAGFSLSRHGGEA
jgi:hypothetical protein